MKRDLAKGLMLEKGPPKGKSAAHIIEVEDLVAAETGAMTADLILDCNANLHLSPVEISTAKHWYRNPTALMESGGILVNFYTYGSIAESIVVPGGCLEAGSVNKMGMILIDGGSVVNLMSIYLARKLNLTLHPTTNLRLRTATAALTQIDHHVLLEVNIAGVVACCVVYCVPEPCHPTYSLLLGRCWLRQCRAFGDYEHDMYLIRDLKGKFYPVPKMKDIPRRLDLAPVLVVEGPGSQEMDRITRLELQITSDEYTERILKVVMRESEEQLGHLIHQENGGLSKGSQFAPSSGTEGTQRELSDSDLDYVNEADSGNEFSH